MFLEVKISWQVQHFVNLHVQISWQVQHFVYLHVQISWQAQHFVNLHVQISWQVICVPPCADFLAGAIQNALRRERTHEMLYFSMEPVAPKLASQGLRNDGCETVSGHARIMLGSFSESSVHWD